MTSIDERKPRRSSSSWWNAETKKELKHIWKLAVPVVATNALLMLLQIEDQIVLGHLGDDELAAAALGNTVYNLAWFFIAGAASACDTLIAQAYGARDYEATEYWTKMGYLVLTMICIPAFVIFQYAEWVVKNIFRQDPHLSHMAGRYTQLLLPGLLFISYFIVMQKSLQARNILMPCVWIMLLANLLNLLGNWFFVFYLEMGFTGSPLATSTSRIITCAITTIYYYGFQQRQRPEGLAQGHSYDVDLKGEEPSDIILHHHQGVGDEQEDFVSEAKNPLLNHQQQQQQGNGEGGEGGQIVQGAPTNKEKLPFWEAFWRFMKLALPGGIMVGLEAWSFDWTITIAAKAGNPPGGTTALDAHQSMMSISAFTFLTIPLAISIAASIRVGNLLGAQRPKQAWLAANICIALGVFCMALFALFILSLRTELGKIFSNDIEVITIVKKLCPILALYQVLDGFQGCCAGALRGCGRQSLIAGLNFAGFWVLGLPCGALLAFMGGLGVYGIWWGFTIGLICCSTLYVLTFSRVNWDLEAKRALNAVMDSKLEHAWEEQLEIEGEQRRLSTSSSSSSNGRGASLLPSP